MSIGMSGIAADVTQGSNRMAGQLRTARRSGLIEQVIDQLRAQITSGEWVVGSRIPTESELAQLTATSRNTVREAVQSLVHAGLLERRQGSGTYVLASSELAGAVSRRVAVAQHVHVLEVRRTLEVGAARLAASRRTSSDIQDLRELLAKRTAARESGDVDAEVANDVALHRRIAEASHNPVLNDLYDNLMQAIHENVRHNVEHRRPPSDDDHVALVTAIIEGDAERAAVEAALFLDELMEMASVTENQAGV
jgi:DNA-binding FadR family transcriptional regulator